MKLLTFVFAALLTVSGSAAEDLGPRQRAEQFFSTLMKGNTDEAYDTLFAESNAPQHSPLVDNLKRQTAETCRLRGTGLSPRRHDRLESEPPSRGDEGARWLPTKPGTELRLQGGQLVEKLGAAQGTDRQVLFPESNAPAPWLRAARALCLAISNPR